MKIAIVGCGALGSFYGAKLALRNHEVHFLLRSDYETVKRDGLTVESVDGDFHVRPNCADRPDTIGRCDLVIIGLKTTANAAFSQLLPPLCDASTAVLTLQNGLGNEDALAELFDPQQILGGLCFVCLNRIRAGHIRHLAHGHIVIGEFAGSATNRTREIAEMFKDADVGCSVRDNLEQAHWEKLVWNIPFNGLGVASSAGLRAVQTGEISEQRAPSPCLTTDLLLADEDWLALVRQLMLEVIESGNRHGHSIDPSLADKMIANTREMGAYRPSTLIDFENGLPLELHSMFLEPLRRARSKGYEPAALANLCAILENLDRR